MPGSAEGTALSFKPITCSFSLCLTTLQAREALKAAQAQLEEALTSKAATVTESGSASFGGPTQPVPAASDAQVLELEGVLAAVRQRADQLEAQLQQARDDAAAAATAATSELQHRRDELGTAQQALLDCQLDLQTARQQLSDCQSELDTVRKQLSVCDSELQAARQQLSECEAELAARDEEVGAVRLELAARSAAAADAVGAGATAARLEAAEVQRALAGSAEELRCVREQLFGAQQQVEALQAQAQVRS